MFSRRAKDTLSLLVSTWSGDWKDVNERLKQDGRGSGKSSSVVGGIVFGEGDALTPGPVPGPFVAVAGAGEVVVAADVGVGAGLDAGEPTPGAGVELSGSPPFELPFELPPFEPPSSTELLPEDPLSPSSEYPYEYEKLIDMDIDMDMSYETISSRRALEEEKT